MKDVYDQAEMKIAGFNWGWGGGVVFFTVGVGGQVWCLMCAVGVLSWLAQNLVWCDSSIFLPP